MNEFLEPFEKLLEAAFPTATVRAIEAGGAWDGAWAEVASSGFLDAMVAEDAGGAGLSLADTGPLLQAIGRHAVPLPVGETMIARRLLAEAGCHIPDGPIALCSAAPGSQAIVMAGNVATHVLVDTGEALVLADTSELSPQATGIHGDLAAHMTVPTGIAGTIVGRPEHGLRPLSALIRATGIAGAAARVLHMTVEHANQRVQFGKPIGKLQAIQQMLSVLAEDAVAVRIAAELACAGSFPPAIPAIATAKSVASDAAARIANSAHAIHGAIGISEEFDLQLYTRRLHAWRLADGSESYWNRLLGELRLSNGSSSVDWVRKAVFATAI